MWFVSQFLMPRVRQLNSQRKQEEKLVKKSRPPSKKKKKKKLTPRLVNSAAWFLLAAVGRCNAGIEPRF